MSSGLGMVLAMYYLEDKEPEFIKKLSLLESKKWELGNSKKDLLMLRHADGSITYEPAEPFHLEKPQ